MTAQPQARETLPAYRSILLAADASDHANRAIREAVALAGLWNARVTGAHVYAARMHDLRFRQMEGGLPEQFRAEDELERQRDIHDDLITRGLSIITDSYLDQAEMQCAAARVDFVRRPLEGKNYHALAAAANGGDYDLLVMGARGLGAIPGGRLGTVCSRVVRRAGLDVLVIKDPEATLTAGPIVVALDGSAKSYGGLLSALALAQHWRVPVHVISAFDPYYHYVAFNRIAGVLSAEAGKVFRFQEQEQLHEEIIDSGLAKIYDGHLAVAESIAREHGVAIQTKLLDGKPHDVIEKYTREVKASLLVLGRLGIHADAGLDIGGNAEHLLHDVDCAVLLSNREHRPPVETVADVTTAWTVEAERRMQQVPDFARNMARSAILRAAQQQGHTVITAAMVTDITASLCPAHARKAMAEIVAAHDQLEPAPAVGPMPWSDAAQALLDALTDATEREHIRGRTQKKARAAGAARVQPEHVATFVDAPRWQAAALARVARVPEGHCRDMARSAAETIAARNGLAEIDAAFMEQVLDTFAAGSQQTMETLPWDKAARARIARAPEMVRGMLVKEIEGWARRHDLTQVTPDAVEAVKQQWAERGVFHLDPSDLRHHG